MENKEDILAQNGNTNNSSNKKKGMSKMKKFWIMFALMISFIYYATSNSSNQYSSNQCPYWYKDTVKRYLKAPSTAKFSGCYMSNGLIKGYVDSQNGFGAMMRARFVCDGNVCDIQ